MTDEELIANLRNSKGWPNLGNAAADRIESLKEELKSQIEHTDDLIRCAEPMMALALSAAIRAADAAEAKLAKAVEALREMLEDPEYWSPYARATLDELEKTE